eukprot:6801688-Pyramimonas_sp.AAC.1
MGVAAARARGHHRFRGCLERLGQPPLRDREGKSWTPTTRRGIGARAAGASAERAARQPAAQ